MKVCLTYVRTYNKPIEFKIAQQFIDELVKAGMPEEMAEILMEKGHVIWEKENLDHSVIYAAEIVD